MENRKRSGNKMKTSVRRELIRLGVFAVVSTLFIAACAFAYALGPDSYIYENSDWEGAKYSPDYNTTKWNILFDSHSHAKTDGGFFTNGGDGGYLTPEQNILWHISMGFNAMAISDHNTYENVEEIMRIAREKYSDKIVVLPGCEWTTGTIHCNLIFPPDAPIESYENILPPKGEITNSTIQEMINATHAAGGIVIVNHIPWTLRVMNSNISRDSLLEWGADYIEIVNWNEWDNESYKFCLENEMGIASGTDMHWPDEIFGYTLMNSSKFTAEAVFSELKERRTDVLYIPWGVPYEVEHKLNPAFVALRPFMQIGAMFAYYIDGIAKIDWLGLGVLLAYIYGAFGIFELVREMGVKKIRAEFEKHLAGARIDQKPAKKRKSGKI